MSDTATLSIDVQLPLDRFDLDVTAEITAPVTGLFGPSGSGKSSLLETLVGLRRLARGTIRLADEAWLDSSTGEHVPTRLRGIGYVPQEGLLFPHWDVRRNLLAGADRARAGGLDPAAALDRVAQLLGLLPLLDRSVSTLSGGERQRVALGRALCSGPRLLLLDEPFAALDLALRRRLLPFLRRVRDELTVPMLFVSHDPFEIQALCDEVIVLRDGAVVGRGEPRLVLSDPALGSGGDDLGGFENVLTGRLDDGTDRRVHLAEGGPVIVVGPGDGPPPGRVLLGLRATDVLVSTERPGPLSARNVLPVTIDEVRAVEGRALVDARLANDLPPLVVEVTPEIPQLLGLAPGCEAFVVFKATACRLYAGQRS
ncbi:MAG: molybdenum ABC transporter ATP-binding protein [Acidobacteriota bacterium]